jgi:hypothetical protein
MSVLVTDEQEATLHAGLAGRMDDHRRLLGEIDPQAARSGYNALVAAAFSLAAVKRFPEGTAPAEVIEYVGNVRSRSERLAQLDARVAERVLLAAVSDEVIEDIDWLHTFQAQVVLLAAMVGDQQLDDEGLDRFMRRARKVADRLLA